MNELKIAGKVIGIILGLIGCYYTVFCYLYMKEQRENAEIRRDFYEQERLRDATLNPPESKWFYDNYPEQPWGWKQITAPVEEFRSAYRPAK